MNKHLHIVCLDVPFPPDYGGAIEMFYKIKYLSETGIKIHLHCFEYGRGRPDQLNEYCEEIHFYPRKKAFSFHLPYIVASRENSALIDRLLSDDYPILLEGTHCTYYINNGALKDRKVWVRMHNIEHLYYKNLARITKNIFEKTYYSIESRLLRKYEKQLPQRSGEAHFLVLNHNEAQILHELGYRNVRYLPPFFHQMEPQSPSEKGAYCLYQGNLSIPENEAAVAFLINRVFRHIDFPLVVAGKNPSDQLKKLSQKLNVSLVANPTNEKMQDLLANAHINIVYTLNDTGVKLKLLNALTSSRFVIANSGAIVGSGLESLCTVVSDEPNELIASIKNLIKEKFDPSEITKRTKFLEKEFSPRANARLLSGWIFS